MVVTIVANDMAFEPDWITVNAGETVAFILENPDSIVHDFTIDDFDGGQLRLQARPRSEAHLILSMPDTPGEWRFYCSVPGHEALGMEGVLEVR